MRKVLRLTVFLICVTEGAIAWSAHGIPTVCPRTGTTGTLSGNSRAISAFGAALAMLSAESSPSVGITAAATTARGAELPENGEGSSVISFSSPTMNDSARFADGSGKALHGNVALSTGVATGIVEDNDGVAYNVKVYGAKCDGATDDTGAIQSAITAAVGTHGSVQLCRGTSLISPPTPKQVFNLTGGNIRVTGCGMGCSILKLKNSAGDYDTIFGPKGRMSNVTFDNFSVDYNSTNNHPTSLTKFRTLVFWGAGSNITFDKLDVTDIDATNVIYAGETNTTITNCHFTLNAGGKYYHDSSILYLSGERTTVQGNYFLGAPNAAGSVTAIETHAGGQTLIGNIVDGFETCANLTGINGIRDSEGVIFTANVCKNGLIGVALWSRVYGEHRRGKGINSFVVLGNTIDIHQGLWTTNPFSGGAVSAPAGIAIDSGSTLLIANVLIANNNISFDLSADKSDPYSNNTGGIAYWDRSGTNSVFNITIKGNTIVNSPSAGLYWGAACQGCDFSGNTFINSGSNLNSTMNSYARDGIEIVTQVAVDIALENETITDNLATTRMVRGIYLGAAANSTLTVSGRINASGTNATAYLYPVDVAATVAPFISLTNVAPALGTRVPPHRVATNSIIYDIPTGINYTTRNGTVWTAAQPH